MVEYGLIAVLIAIACIATATALGDEEKAFYIRASDDIAEALSSITSEK